MLMSGLAMRLVLFSGLLEELFEGDWFCGIGFFCCIFMGFGGLVNDFVDG